MNWKDFFDLKVLKSGEVFFKAQLKVHENFSLDELLIRRFEHFNLTHIEKKKLSLPLRKIILCHDYFRSSQFKKLCKEFQRKIEHCPEKELIFTTQGGGIYLFLELMQHSSCKGKKIICYTSELPLPIMSLPKHPAVQFIYSPHQMSFLSDFSTLWKESELMALFELKEFKASA